MKILLTGLPGSGKTTQAKILAKELGILFISTGELLRKLSESDQIPDQEQEVLSSGGLINDELVAKILQKRISDPDTKNGFVIDGYPRSLDQIKLFDPGFNHVIYIEIPDEKVKERLVNRGRDDDKPDVVDRRLEIFHSETKPLVEYFKKNSKFDVVDGQGSVDEVRERIKKALNLDGQI